MDVPQCQLLVSELVQLNPKIDPNLVFLCGGSHGGFIVLHLSSQYPVMSIIIRQKNPTKFSNPFHRLIRRIFTKALSQEIQ